MPGWNFSIGKVFGVEVRLHSFFVILLFLSMTWSGYVDRPLLRGASLWFLVVLAVSVREIARAIAAAWFGLELRSVLLLPIGGIQAYANAESLAKAGEPKVQRILALVGPFTSLIFGLVVAGAVLSISPGVNLTATRWVSPEHLLRSMVWVNLLLAAVNLLPAWPLDAGRVMKGEMLRARVSRQNAPEPRAPKPAIPSGLLGLSRGGISRAAINAGPAIAIGLIVFGFMFVNWWLIMAGIAVLLGAQVERQGLSLQADVDFVKVRDVMLTDYSLISASATLEDAVEQARHSLQDVFPVVRAGNMVGAVARQTVLEALELTGNGYVQGIMTREVQTAAPGDSLVEALGRVTALPGVSSQLVAVLGGKGGEQVLGIITPQNLQRSMGLLARRIAPGSRATDTD